MTVVEDFAADYFVVQGLTQGRQVMILRALRLFEEFAGAAPETVGDRELSAFVTSLAASGLHPNTVRKELRAIKPFYRWCWRNRIIDAESFMRIGEVRPPRGASAHGEPRPYKRKEIDQFWNELAERYPLTTENMIVRYQRGRSRYPRVANHAIYLQTAAIASLALFGGLRSTEIRTAPMDAIHPDNDFIVVRGKSPMGERQGYREVPYTEEGREIIGRWLEFRAILGPDHESPWLVLSPRATRNSIMPSHPFDPISEKGWERVLTSVGKWELHRLRHTCATEWLRAGVELERVRELLGHASIAQTLRYAKITRDDVARSMRRSEREFSAAVGRRRQTG